jgi:hypothetical protein
MKVFAFHRLNMPVLTVDLPKTIWFGFHDRSFASLVVSSKSKSSQSSESSDKPASIRLLHNLLEFGNRSPFTLVITSHCAGEEAVEDVWREM